MHVVQVLRIAKKIWNGVKSKNFLKVKAFLFSVLLFVPMFVYVQTARATTSWYNTSWGYRTKLTIDHTKVPNTNQSYFPVLINRIDTNWKVTGSGGHVGQADGGDFVFTSSDGTTKLDHEIEKYVSTTGELIAWVEVPTLATATDTEIYLYYGNSGVADQWNITGTWNSGGNNYFKGVYHLPDGTTLAALDSTSNAYNGTITSATAVTGQVGGGANFDGTGQRIVMSGMPNYTSAFTIGGWVKSGGSQDATWGGTIIGKRSICANATTDFPVSLTITSTGNISANLDRGNDYSLDSTIAYTMSNPTTTWHYVTVTYTANGTSYLYVDGTQVGSVATNFTIATTNMSWAVGRSTPGNSCGNGSPFLGKLDEMRVSNVVRSADWIATEYNNQNSPSTFYTAASEEYVTTPDAPTSLTPTVGNTQVSLSWTAPANDGGLSITDYVVDYKIATESSWSTFADGTSTSTSATVTGLSNGVSYDFRVSTVNAVGQGTASSNATTTPATVPTAPTIGTATGGNAEASVAFTTAAGYTDWYNPSWGYRTKITIDHTKVPNTNQSYFPVLINRTDNNWKVVASGGHVGQSDGGDFVITSSDGTTKLDHELEKYTSTTGEVIAWVEVPTLSTSVDTVLYMYYGNAAVADQWNINGTWDEGGSANFKGTWHLPDGSSLNVNDSTSNAAHGSLVDVPAATTGKIDGGASFDATNDAVDFGAVATTATSATYSFWVNFSDITTKKRIALDWGGSSASLWTFNLGLRSTTDTAPSVGNARMQIRAYDLGAGGSTNNRVYGGTNISANTWYHVAVTGNATTYKIYINGTAETLTTGTGSNNGRMVGSMTKAGTIKTVIGTSYLTNTYDWPNDGFQGLMDEVRISNVVRSADWIATEYNNQSSPSTFYSVSPENDYTLPPSTGGATITGYTATSNPGSITGTGVSSPITVTGLTNGVAYTFTVVATNSVGNSSASSASNSVTPATTPGAPTAFSATAGNAQSALSWNAPASNGGASITDYVVEYKLTSEPTTWSIFSDGTSNLTTATVTGLTNGSSYDFRVSAVNSVGQGTASSAVSATPLTVPDAPTIGTATGGNTQATVTFSAPASNGGSAITGYTVTSSPGSITGTGSASPITVTGLTNGTAYTFTVTATNVAGTSSSSSASNSVTPATVPGAPTNLASTVSSSSIGLSWSAPASNGGASITDYVIEYQLTTGGTWSVFSDGTSTNTTTTVTGLSNNTSYDFRVSAVNAAGQSAASGTTTATPGEPAQVLIQSFSDLTTPSIGTAVRITNEGAIAYEYQYTWCITDASNNLCGGGNDVFSSSAAKLIQPLENWDTTLSSTVSSPGAYYFHITVTYGSSSSYANQSFTAAATYPDAPTIGTATAGNAEASVTFSAPTSNGGSTITEYTVTSNPGGLTGTGSSSPITVTGLTNGIAYTFTVTATNAIGTSASSSASNSATPVTVPGSPTGLSATAGNAQVALLWTAPVSNGGSALTDYVVEYKLSTDVSWSVFSDGTSTNTSATVTGLTNNVSYDFRVSAVNTAGQSSVNGVSGTSPTPPPAPVSSGGGGHFPIIYEPVPVEKTQETKTPIQETIETEEPDITENSKPSIEKQKPSIITIVTTPIQKTNQVSAIPKSESVPEPVVQNVGSVEKETQHPDVVVEVKNSNRDTWIFVGFIGIFAILLFIFIIIFRMRSGRS